MQQDKQTAPLRCEFIYHNGDGSEKDRCDNRAEKGNIACKLHAAPAAIEQARPQTPKVCDACESGDCMDCLGTEYCSHGCPDFTAAAEPAPERTPRLSYRKWLLEKQADGFAGILSKSLEDAYGDYCARAVVVPEPAATGRPFNNQRINERVQEWEKAHRVPAAQPESEIVKVAEELSEAIWLKMNCYCSNCPEPTMKAAKKLKELLKQWKSSVTSSVEQSLSLGSGSSTSSVTTKAEAQVSTDEPAPTPSREADDTQILHAALCRLSQALGNPAVIAHEGESIESKLIDFAIERLAEAYSLGTKEK